MKPELSMAIEKKSDICETQFWDFCSLTKVLCNQFFAFRVICQRVFGVPHMLWDLSGPVRGLPTQNCLSPSIVPSCMLIPCVDNYQKRKQGMTSGEAVKVKSESEK